MSSCFITTIIATIPKNTLDLHSKTQTNNDKFWKMSTIVEFRLLVLDSLKYCSKAESPINRSAKAVISRTLTTSRHNHLFIYLFFFILYLFIYLLIFFPIFTENRHCRLICIAIATVVVGWPERIYIYIYIYEGPSPKLALSEGGSRGNISTITTAIT